MLRTCFGFTSCSEIRRARASDGNVEICGWKSPNSRYRVGGVSLTIEFGRSMHGSETMFWEVTDLVFYA